LVFWLLYRCGNTLDAFMVVAVTTEEKNKAAALLRVQ
jgi:hypothetical protein